jgi:adenine-specific DNA-methyltransferase
MDNNYNRLKNVLKEVFQLDQADLDFGIYRIMNQKRNEINDFLENRLLPQVTEILKNNGDGENAKAQQELDKAIEQANSLGVDPESLPKVIKLRNKLTSSVSIDSLEQEVYSHLANFFKRYYKDGDFISLRRYKKDVYAIPYEGEEVKLHWANHDQYYIKSSEYLKNYGFNLSNGKSVKFELKEASTEQNNNKEQPGKERRFQLFSELPVEVSEDGATMIINFTFEELDKKVKQSKLNDDALEALVNLIPPEFHAVLEKRPTDKNKKRTLLEKHILDFTARNSFDYFIHKDLGRFLQRELDFYIKNEVLYLDDINTDNEQDFTSQLSKVKAIKQVAQKIITFLAQLENFQKKLWLKKKFVVATNYCITLDRIPEKYYEEIALNKAQLEEWKELFKIHEQKNNLLTIAYTEPLTVDFLKSQPYLVLDTKFFTQDFKDELLSEFDNLDKQVSGTLINSENFQAIGLIKEKFKEKADSIYIDPPYNTDASPILYKNSFKKSSWNSLIHDRVSNSINLLKSTGVLCATIDDFQQRELNFILSEVNNNSNRLGIVPIRNNPSGRPTPTGFSISHEYAMFFSYSENAIIGKLKRDARLNSRYKEVDEQGNFMWELLRKRGTDSERKDSPKAYYPFYYSDGKLRLPEMEWDEIGKNWINIEPPTPKEKVLYPIDETGLERRWRWGLERARLEIKDLIVKEKDGLYTVYYKYRPPEGVSPTTNWIDSKYSSTEHGTGRLKPMFGDYDPFSYPKSVYAVEDCIYISGMKNKESLCIDYFAGSGTTGHSVLNLNREDGGNRKFILVEMGIYFNSVTKPRVLKAIYSDLWKNGKPIESNGISQFIKYHDLESYEDVLNNLSLLVKSNQERLLNDSSFKDEYMLSYMLDVESRDSLLCVDAFKNPFNYKLNITRNNESQETVIDLVETFNYLLGLHVKIIQTIRGFKVITGVTNERDEETLVIWRNTEEKSNKDLNDFFTKMEFSTRDTEFQRIYVNGDNHLENLKTGDDKWKVVLIEEEFIKRMFDVQDV